MFHDIPEKIRAPIAQAHKDRDGADADGGVLEGGDMVKVDDKNVMCSRKGAKGEEGRDKEEVKYCEF